LDKLITSTTATAGGVLIDLGVLLRLLSSQYVLYVEDASNGSRLSWCPDLDVTGAW